MVAVVSMKTIMKKNRPSTAVSEQPLRKKPYVPNNCQPPMSKPWVSTPVPGPIEETQPGPTGALNQLPQPSAKP
jgi:hypothetical protein